MTGITKINRFVMFITRANVQNSAIVKIKLTKTAN